MIARLDDADRATKNSCTRLGGKTHRHVLRVRISDENFPRFSSALITTPHCYAGSCADLVAMLPGTRRLRKEDEKII